MDARDVLDVLTILEEDGIYATLHGGWGVDAVIGAQDRDHSDVDLLVPEAKLPKASTILESVGFSVSEDVDPDSGPATATMVDRNQRQVDLTVLRTDDAGAQWLGDGREAVAFPLSAFTNGWIAGRQVRCVSVVKQVELHDGYTPRERDRHDMTALQIRFGILAPVAYR